jgi:hypothetical protein
MTGRYNLSLADTEKAGQAAEALLDTIDESFNGNQRAAVLANLVVGSIVELANGAVETRERVHAEMHRLVDMALWIVATASDTGGTKH